MDSVPATVPSITATPGDPELVGPLSVLYAAFIAKLLEVTVPIPGEGPKLSQAGGWVLSRLGALIVQRRNGVCQIRGKQDVSMLFREAGGSVFEKVSSLFFFLIEYLRSDNTLCSGVKSWSKHREPTGLFCITPGSVVGWDQCDSVLVEGCGNSIEQTGV